MTIQSSQSRIPSGSPLTRMLRAKIEAHLDESQVSYEDHLGFAVRASARLAYASVASVVHAFVPALFPATAARIVIELYKERLENHPNPRYQEMMHGAPEARAAE